MLTLSFQGDVTQQRFRGRVCSLGAPQFPLFALPVLKALPGVCNPVCITQRDMKSSPPGGRELWPPQPSVCLGPRNSLGVASSNHGDSQELLFDFTGTNMAVDPSLALTHTRTCCNFNSFLRSFFYPLIALKWILFPICGSGGRFVSFLWLKGEERRPLWGPSKLLLSLEQSLPCWREQDPLTL